VKAALTPPQHLAKGDTRRLSAVPDIVATEPHQKPIESRTKPERKNFYGCNLGVSIVIELCAYMLIEYLDCIMLTALTCANAPEVWRLPSW
jgi:hypothetical protein